MYYKHIIIIKVRRKGGNNDHPSPLDFLFRCRLLLAEGIMSFCKNANCEGDSDVPLVPVQILNSNVSSAAAASFETSNNLVIDESGFIEIDDILKNVDMYEQDEALAANPAAFVAGYLARYLLKKGSCKGCKMCENLLTQEKNLTPETLFLNFKQYDCVKLGLTYPSDFLIKTVLQLGEAFNALFKKFSAKQGIKHKIVSNIMNIEHSWLNCEEHAENAWLQLINLYSKMMIYNKIKWQSQQLISSKKYTRKIKKLK